MLLLRVVILRRTGLTSTAIAVAGIYETLTSMAAGAMIGAVLLPWSGLVFDDGSLQRYAIVGVATLPIGAILLNRLAVRVARRYRGPDQVLIPKPPFWLLMRGLLQASVGWLMLGASLRLTVAGLSDADLPLTADSAAGLVVANAIAYISGFVAVILPGGLGGARRVVAAHGQRPTAAHVGRVGGGVRGGHGLHAAARLDALRGRVVAIAVVAGPRGCRPPPN